MNSKKLNATHKPSTSGKIDKVSYWSEIMDDWENSRDPQDTFCENKGVSLSQFSYWRTRLGRRKNVTKSKMIPLKVAEPSALMGRSLQIRLPTGVQLIIPDGCSEQTLKLVLKLTGCQSC